MLFDLVAFPLFVAFAAAGSITDIKHVVLFMQENRAFDHYFGTMPGVRGFADPNVQVNPDGRTTFQQLVDRKMSDKVDTLTPWYLNYLGGHWFNATACSGAGSNGWIPMHKVWNRGLTNQWAIENTPWSLGFFKRSDIPTHFDVAEGWTVADMYQEGMMAATDPNRIVWMSGNQTEGQPEDSNPVVLSTVNTPGSPSNPDGNGGMMLDNAASPGCQKPKLHLNCFPMTWKTVPEYWQDAGVTWQLYQDVNNFEDNMLAYFEQYQIFSNDSEHPLTKHGNSYIGLEKFYEDARDGTLPMVSYIIGPGELTEHPPWLPSDGAWLINQVVDAVTQGPSYNDTVIMLSYDEEGGYADHVTPYHAPPGTPGEWIDDPWGVVGEVPIGPGFRIPFMVISPWTRGGHVFTEHADHTSQIMFVEEWLEAHGYKNVRTPNITPWRREHMSNLVNAFDFDHPDYTLPTVAAAPSPLRNPHKPAPTDGLIGDLYSNYIGAAKCWAEYPFPRPPVPYGPENANADVSKLAEEGFKQVRGALTEGRYLTFELNGQALTNVDDRLVYTKASPAHEDVKQRWVLHQQGDGDSNFFTICGAANGKCIGVGTSLTETESAIERLEMTDRGNGNGYTITRANGSSIDIGLGWKVSDSESDAAKFSLYSVTYHF